MHKDMPLLYELQQIDTAIAELEADLRSLDDGSALRERLAEAEAELERRQAAHHQDYATQGRKEAELEKTETKRKALMGKAYGGTIANPKELETLEKEIESLERIKDRLENELLELFDKVDAQKRAVEEQEAIVESLRSTLAETEATFARETARLTAEITRLNEERTQISNCVAAESLQIYERIRERAANVAVAVVQGRTCSACHVNLPIVRINRLQTGSDFEKCESCMRLLWIANEAEADVEDSSSTAD